MRLKNGKNPRNSIKRELFWGIKTAREYARIKIDGLRLVGGNPDFTNAPGHGDDDARFYDRQQAYVHAPDTPPRPPRRVAPKPELTIHWYCSVCHGLYKQ